MKLLDDYNGTEGLDKLGDVADPTWSILETINAEKKEEGFTVAKMLKIILKKHNDDIMEILSIMNGMTVKELNEKYSLRQILYMIKDLFKDELFMDFFGFQSLMKDDDNFGSVTEISEEEK